jgi:PLP dependent protein
MRVWFIPVSSTISYHGMLLFSLRRMIIVISSFSFLVRSSLSFRLHTLSSSSYSSFSAYSAASVTRRRAVALLMSSSSSPPLPPPPEPAPAAATTTTTTMEEDATMITEVKENYQRVRDHINSLHGGPNNNNVRLVAVSKTKPIALLRAAYDAGCRCFGENYVQEMIEKVPAFSSLSPDDPIAWHFIGTLQSNKAKLLVTSVWSGATSTSSTEELATEASSSPRQPSLTIETVTSIKLANKLEQAAADIPGDIDCHITVFVQINTSDEDSKGGICNLIEATQLCRYIDEKCDHLTLAGLMTIGAPGDMSCFTRLQEYKTAIETSLVPNRTTPLELSMGMSNDYEAAILAGSTNVRVGSTIFGARDYSNNK